MHGIVDRLDKHRRGGVIIGDDGREYPFLTYDLMDTDVDAIVFGDRVEFCRCVDARDVCRAVSIRLLRGDRGSAES